MPGNGFDFSGEDITDLGHDLVCLQGEEGALIRFISFTSERSDCAAGKRKDLYPQHGNMQWIKVLQISTWCRNPASGR